MNKEIADQWIKALRSGEYKQTTGVLRDSTGFCCLGVLCNLHAQTHPEIAVKQRSRSRYMGEGKVLPAAVMKWAEIESEEGEFLGDSLAHLNDDGESFSKIAKVIRAKVKEL